MSTQLLRSRAGEITTAMETVSREEGVTIDYLVRMIAEGKIVIPANKNHRNLKPCGIGKGLKTKVNANIGTSTAYPDIDKELQKLKVAVEAGADAVMDLSTAKDINATRRCILEAAEVPIGTVPIYQAAVETMEKHEKLVDMKVDDFFRVIEQQCADGVDFITVHCGVTLRVLECLKKQGRLTDIVSRGGSFLTGWMLHNEKENPLYEQYDRLLEIALKYDVTLSLGDGLRPGCLDDATDRPQVEELIILGELVDRARAAGVQSMVEGPGHVPLDQIEANIMLQKSICKQAPFYVLGPIVTDVAPGYDHITSAIGGALAAAAGADFLCYVTPAEHLGLPTLEDVKEGVIAARVAGHAADIVKDVAGAREWDRKMARARKALDWEGQISLALDPVKAQKMRETKNPGTTSTCSMCGDYCAMKVVADFLGKAPSGAC